MHITCASLCHSSVTNCVTYATDMCIRVSQSQLETLQHLCIPGSSSQRLHQWAPYICEGRFSEKKDFSTNTWPKPTQKIAKVTKTLQTMILSFRSSAL